MLYQLATIHPPLLTDGQTNARGTTTIAKGRIFELTA